MCPTCELEIGCKSSSQLFKLHHKFHFISPLQVKATFHRGIFSIRQAIARVNCCLTAVPFAKPQSKDENN